MNILIIGGTGFISGRLTDKLLEAGHHVTNLTRGISKKSFNNNERLRFELDDRRGENTLNEVVKSRTFDAMFDMIAYEPQESRQAAEIFKGKVGRFIHCSTVSVYMISDQVQCPITEDQWQKPLMPYFARNPFGMD